MVQYGRILGSGLVPRLPVFITCSMLVCKSGNESLGTRQSLGGRPSEADLWRQRQTLRGRPSEADSWRPTLGGRLSHTPTFIVYVNFKFASNKSRLKTRLEGDYKHSSAMALCTHRVYTQNLTTRP